MRMQLLLLVCVAGLLDGTRSHVGSYGLADIDVGTAVEPDTLFRIGSITKADNARDSFCRTASARH